MRKKILSTAIAMGLGVIVAAPIVSAQKLELDFTAKTNENNPGFSAPNPKNDNEDHAYVTTTNTKLKSTDRLRYSVYSSDKNKEVAKALTLKGSTILNRQKICYLSGYAKKGRRYRLGVVSYKRNVQIRGRWNS